MVNLVSNRDEEKKGQITRGHHAPPLSLWNVSAASYVWAITGEKTLGGAKRWQALNLRTESCKYEFNRYAWRDGLR